MRVPAREWGGEWAEKTYGEGWARKVREGIVKSKCSHKERVKVKRQPKPSHFVQFEDRVEKMLDSEITKYKVSEGEYVMPAGELEGAMFCYDRCMNEPNEFLLYLNIHMPKEIKE